MSDDDDDDDFDDDSDENISWLWAETYRVFLARLHKKARTEKLRNIRIA
jgi:hypothetical protein